MIGIQADLRWRVSGCQELKAADIYIHVYVYIYMHTQICAAT